ncbi:flagellar motor protein MotB [Alcaligenes faecalis]|uniref:flagellar motor protein MotB n=1 Tax=Alcaligenes faecalis TaxID=511 RepID=UPI0029339504|nr:flagellar motor protein MotB [Alcaligenes faecalis]MDV2116590.1 flagellar motor protein MotB [Alcaligenes faecalis]
MSNHTDRVVIRRKKMAHAEHHGGSWKIAYADFMTAMMAFFLVMWILSLVPKQDLKEIADYFRMPLMDAVSGGYQADYSRSVIPGGQPSLVPNPHPGVSSNQAADDRQDVERLEDLKSALEELIRIDPVLKEFRPQLLLDMTQDGLRIQIIDRQSRPMFSTGSAQVQLYMRAILRSLSAPLNEMPNRILISGHTDSLQYASGERLYSNWELSADRANAARQELVAGGLAEDKVKQVVGLADSVSLVKDNPAAAVNRRISLLVLNSRAERRMDEQAASGSQEFDLREAMQETEGPISIHIPGLPEMPSALPMAP